MAPHCRSEHGKKFQSGRGGAGREGLTIGYQIVGKL